MTSWVTPEEQVALELRGVPTLGRVPDLSCAYFGNALLFKCLPM
jgi:hypothetical protein